MLQVLIAPVIMWPRPEIEPLMMRQVCCTPLVTALVMPGVSVAGSKAYPPAIPMRQWVAKPPSGCGSSTRLGVSSTSSVSPARQTESATPCSGQRSVRSNCSGETGRPFTSSFAFASGACFTATQVAGIRGRKSSAGQRKARGAGWAATSAAVNSGSPWSVKAGTSSSASAEASRSGASRASSVRATAPTDREGSVCRRRLRAPASPAAASTRSDRAVAPVRGTPAASVPAAADAASADAAGPATTGTDAASSCAPVPISRVATGSR